MGLLLFKFLPYIWPLLKEFLEGKKDHPYFKDGVRAKSKSKLFAFILLLLLLGTGNWAYDLHGSIAELEKKLAEAEKAPKVSTGVQYTREHLDLELCKRDQRDVELKLKEQDIRRQEAESSLKMCATELEWERLNKPTTTPSIRPATPKPKASETDKAVGDAVQKQLEELQKKEGNGNAPH